MSRIIHLHWDGPFGASDLSSLNDPRKDYGIYQVYACHSVYGSSSLVYIGMAARQTFGVRIQQHKWETGSEPDPKELRFYVGRLKGIEPITPEQWATDIRLVEKLLIHDHGPAYNSTHMMSIHNEAEVMNIRVFSFGSVRSLRREVSGYMSTPEAKFMNKQPVYERPEAIPLPGIDT